MLEQSWSIYMDYFMVLMVARLRVAPVADSAGYHAISACIICRVAVTAATAAARAGLT